MDIFDPKQLTLIQMDPEENASLETLLNKHNLPLLELFSIKNIQPKIRSNFTYFIKYCQKNQDFCFNLIDIGIKCPMHQGASDTMKQACYIAADVLTCDQDVVAQLLILPDKSKPKRKDSGDESDQFQEIQENIETQANDSAGPQQAELLVESLTEEQTFNKKYKYLVRLLEYIGNSQTKNLDQNCINYMVKALNCLVRKKAQEFFYFFNKKPEIFRRLIELNNFSSISQFLIKILSDDEIEADKSQKLKRQIVQGVLKKLMENVSEEDFTERLDFLEQLFQTNKYASDDDRTQLQKMSDVFSSKQTIEFFYQFLTKPKTPTEFFNAASYLVCIIKRMNIDEEIDPYSYSNEPKEETMMFEVDVLYKEFSNILKQGYLNLNHLKYSEPYKQKTADTRFYELLVLLSKNSRFNNCLEGKPKTKTSVLVGNNIIFPNRQGKILVLKELLKQFTSQSKNGINRISMISLVEKVLNMQVYESRNHPKQNDGQTFIEIKNETEKISNEIENIKQSQLSNSAQKQPNQHKQNQQILDVEDKKTKINKIKAGLKLNIKKFSLETNEPAEKEEKKVSATKIDADNNSMKKTESTLKKDEVFEVLQYFSQNIQSETSVSEIKKKQKNNETEIGALINKLLMIFSNSIEWSEYNKETAIIQKQRFISEIQKIFPYFNFIEICKKYSVTLATTKHPNASAKEKTNPELTFTTEFFKIYNNKKQEAPPNGKQSKNKNLEFSDSDFKSDEEEIHAVKCSIEDFRKLTGIKKQQNFNLNVQFEPVSLWCPITEQKTQQKSQSPSKEAPLKEQPKEKNIFQEPIIYKPIEKMKLEEKPKVEQKEDKNKDSEKKDQVEAKKQKKVPLEFYIKHQLILV